MIDVNNKTNTSTNARHRGSRSSSAGADAGVDISSGVAKVVAVLFILCTSMQICCGSAIPIWELLTRSEKMSFLYSTFGQLVSVHCKATAATSAIPVNQCKHDLLSYGYEKLQTFSDSQLEQLDPYQHNANELIWSSIMRDHRSSMLITTRKPLDGASSDSSIIILTHSKAASTAPIAQALLSENPLFVNEAANSKHKLTMAMDMDIAYDSDAVNRQQPINKKPYTETFLSGPLVFRLRPDGTPVEEDKHKQLPHDDDLEAFQLSSIAVAGDAFKTTTNAATSATEAGSRPKHHRKIAMISDLKQQHLASLALHRELQPPYEEQARMRRHHQSRPIQLIHSYQNSPFSGFYLR